MKVKTSILVVTHNHGKEIMKLLDSLELFGYSHTYFCDAASTDDTYKILKKSRYSNQVLRKEVLEGFSKNNNDLIRHFNLNTPYYLLLNPDTYFNNDFLSTLEKQMESFEKCGIVAPLVKYPDETLQVTWKYFPGPITVLRKRLGFLKAKEENQMSGPDIDWCLGACMLISAELIKEGQCLLDERYRLYCEDIDICFETHQRGKRVIGTDQSFVYHALNESSSRKIFSKYNYWNVGSILKFFWKWKWAYLLRIRKSPGLWRKRQKG